MNKQLKTSLPRDYEPLLVEVFEIRLEEGYAISGSDLDNGGSLFGPTNWD